MDVNQVIGPRIVFAQAAWVLTGLFLYLTSPGVALLSSSAAVFFVGGFFASAIVFGLPFHGLRRGIARTRKSAQSNWLLPIEAVVIFIAASFAFERLETLRTGVPLEYAQQRDDFDYALKAFAVASRLEEQAKTGRDSGKINSDIETRLVELMEAGVEKGRGVSDGFLTYLDPALPQPYRQLVRGHDLRAAGRRGGDLAKQTEGNQLVQAFYQDFLPSRADAIIAKLGVTPQ